MFVGIALITIPAFLSGFAAQEMLKGRAGHFGSSGFADHESSALLSIWFMEVTGALALIGLWQSHGTGRPAHWNVSAMLLFSLLTVALISRTGYTAGEIRHPEVRPAAEASTAEPVVTEGPIGAFMSRFEPAPDKFSDAMTFSKWWWTFMMAMHFIGLIMIVGTVGLLDVRIMGFFKQLPVAPVASRLLPWGLAGLGDRQHRDRTNRRFCRAA